LDERNFEEDKTVLFNFGIQAKLAALFVLDLGGWDSLRREDEVRGAGALSFAI
jgi:hypothetical protein